ncbi:MAG: CBS domain-containing protein [Candidatus Margulisiibacteriota bacterium]|nr:CBS domain-containing protein [Candidatus Margulisiibacteriota bacterium]
MVLFTEMFVSELKGVPVVDKAQESIGHVKDVLITLGESFPKVTGLLVSRTNGKMSAILLGDIELVGKQFVSTSSIKKNVAFTELRNGELLLCRDVLDKQIVDVEGARVVRVNDLQLAKVDQDIRLIAVDVGFKGMLRRLGILPLVEWFEIDIHDRLIGWDHVEQLRTDLGRGVITIPHKHLSELHPADIAHIISQVHQQEKNAIFESLSESTAAEALHELEPMIAARILMTLNTKKALNILEKMPVDEAADVLGDLTEEKREEFLRLIKVRKAAEIRKLLKHEDETAGGLMTTEFITIPRELTVEQTINRLREMAPSAETIYYLYVVDEEGHLAGVQSLRQLIVSAPDKKIADLMVKDDIIALSAGANQREVADTISKYNLLAVPIIDDENKIIGIVTVDDVVEFVLPPISRRRRQIIG